MGDRSFSTMLRKRGKSGLHRVGCSENQRHSGSSLLEKERRKVPQKTNRSVFLLEFPIEKRNKGEKVG